MAVYGSTYACAVSFLLDTQWASGAILNGATVAFYAAGSTISPVNLQTIWLDRDKANPATNPYTLDSNGTALLFGDGLYRVVITNTDGVAVFDRDYLNFIDVSFAISQTPGANEIPVLDENGDLPSQVSKINGATIWTSANDGTGSGLDADVIKGQRIISGKVQGSDGAVLLGTGFTVTRSAAGTYAIIYTTPFTNAPVITATYNNNSSTIGDISVTNSQTTQCSIITRRGYWSTSWIVENYDFDFYFIAIGQ